MVMDTVVQSKTVFDWFTLFVIFSAMHLSRIYPQTSKPNTFCCDLASILSPLSMLLGIFATLWCHDATGCTLNCAGICLVAVQYADILDQYRMCNQLCWFIAAQNVLINFEILILIIIKIILVLNINDFLRKLWFWLADPGWYYVNQL